MARGEDQLFLEMTRLQGRLMQMEDIYEVGPFPFFHFGRAGAKGEDGEVTYQGVGFHGQCHECLLPQHVQ